MIDLGDLFHKEWFFIYKCYDGGLVFSGDNTSHKIIGRGKVKLMFREGKVNSLFGVLHKLGLLGNLISTTKMNDLDVQLVFSKNCCKMDNGAMVLAKGIRYRILFKF